MSKLSEVVVPKLFVNVIVEEIVSPLWVAEPDRWLTKYKVPLLLILIVELDEDQVPLWLDE